MAHVRVERRLAAILAADVVGYSRLIEADEAGTLSTVTMRGNLDEAQDLMEEAFRLNPFQPIWYGTLRAVLLYSLKRYSEAVQDLRRVTTPGYWSRTRLAACYGQLGRASEAEAQVATILREKPDFSIAAFIQRDALLERPEDREHLREGVIKAGLPA